MPSPGVISAYQEYYQHLSEEFQYAYPIMTALSFYLQEQLRRSTSFLIVNESTNNQRLFAHYLYQLGYEYRNIYMTDNGQQALEKLWGEYPIISNYPQEPEYDLVLTGLKFNGGLCCGWDLVEVCNQVIVRDQALPRPYLVILTGYSAQGYLMEECRALGGVDDFYNLPVTLTDFQQMIKRYEMLFSHSIAFG